MPFTKEYLVDYEEKIRQLPLDELYDILNLIRDDPFKADDSPERVKIVEKRIRELDTNYINEQNKDPIGLIPTEELNEKLKAEYKKTEHTESNGLTLIGFILMFFAALFSLVPYDRNTLNISFIFAGIAMLLWVGSLLIDQCFFAQGTFVHKKTSPWGYWIYVAMFSFGGILGIICGIFPNKI